MDSVVASDKQAYLAMIQEPISRLSTASSIFKGFAATIVAGFLALSNEDIRLPLLLLSFIPVIAFAVIDTYYLQLERLYRGLYNDVLMDRHKTDFSMQISYNRDSKKRANASIFQCLKSPSIWLFYPVIIAVLIAICIFRT